MEWLTRYGPPELTWLVAALLVQRNRQRWHHEVARQLRDRQRHDDTGAVPGLRGWKYYRHGIGVCLYGPDREILDVDFNDDAGAVIDVWFFARRIESLRNSRKWLAERRLWRWRPRREVIVEGCEELVTLGAATYWTGHKNQIVLAPELDARSCRVADDLAAPGSADRWLSVLESGGETAYAARHPAWTRERLSSSSRPGDLPELALQGVTIGQAIELCRPLLKRADRAAGRAIELLRGRPEVPPLPEVADVLRAASVAEDHAFAPFQACAYLIERGIEREFALERFDVWSHLERVKGFNGHPLVAEFAIFALRKLPDRAMPLVRKALRSPVPICVWQMAGLLATIDRRWCHRELKAAIAEPRAASREYRRLGFADVQDLAQVLRAQYPDEWDGA